MKVQHRVLVESTCPVNGDPDRYIADVDLRPGKFILCEAVLAAVQSLVKEVSHCRGRVRTVVVGRPSQVS